MEGDVITLQDLFLFDHSAGFDDAGHSLGTLKSTGLRPKFLDKLAAAGVDGRPDGVRLREVRAMTRRRPAARARRSLLAALVRRCPRPASAADEPGEIVEVNAQTATAAASSSRPTASPTASTIDPDSVEVHGRRPDASVDRREPLADDAPAATASPSSRSTTARAWRGEQLDAAKAAAHAFLDDAAGRRPGRPGHVRRHGDTAGRRPTTDRAQIRDGDRRPEHQRRPVGTALFDGVALAASTLTGHDGARSVCCSPTATTTAAARRPCDDAVDARHRRRRPRSTPSTSVPARVPPPELDGARRRGAGGQVVSEPTPADLGAASSSDAAQAIAQPAADHGADLPADVAGSPATSWSRAKAGGDRPQRHARSTRFADRRRRPARADHGPHAGQAETPPSVLRTVAAAASCLGALFLGLLVDRSPSSFVAAAPSARRASRAGSGAGCRSTPSPAARRRKQRGDHDRPRAAARSRGPRSSSPAGSCSGGTSRPSLALRLEAAGVPLRAAEWMLIHIGVALAPALLLLLRLRRRRPPDGRSGWSLGLAAALGLPHRQGVPPHVRVPRPAARTPCSCSPAACRPATPCRRRWTPSCARASSPSPASSTARWSRRGSACRSRTPSTASPTRMKSKDFAWVVMAIRIQREVGGNLAELLTTVAARCASASGCAARSRCSPPRAGCRPGSSACSRPSSRSTSLLVRPELPRAAGHRAARLADARRSAPSCSPSARSGCARPSRWRSDVDADAAARPRSGRHLRRDRPRPRDRRRHHLRDASRSARSLAAVRGHPRGARRRCARELNKPFAERVLDAGPGPAHRSSAGASRPATRSPGSGTGSSSPATRLGGTSTASSRSRCSGLDRRPRCSASRCRWSLGAGLLTVLGVAIALTARRLLRARTWRCTSSATTAASRSGASCPTRSTC